MSKDFGKSQKLFSKASQYLVGGVNSPVRAFNDVDNIPVFIKKAVGSKIYDVDGNVYIDFVGAYGPMILGHADPSVLSAIHEALVGGMVFGANCQAETTLAELILSVFPFYDKIRFVNSGTEAVMSAIRLARGVTGKSKVIKFAGCYHGHMDDLLVAAGSGVASMGLPGSAGVTKESAQNTIVLPYNDFEAVRDAFKKYKMEIAAVITEPVAGNMGLVLPKDGFLGHLRSEADSAGALLISDEVMCGFREYYGSAMIKQSVKADITCLGKIIGGGMPVGAFLANAAIMDNVAPLGPVYQAGTFSGNPIVMAAGISTLQQLKNPRFYLSLNSKTTKIVQGIKNETTYPVQINQYGSMFSLFFSKREILNYEDAKRCDTHIFPSFFNKLTTKGLFVPPSPFETWFVSKCHSDNDINKTIEIITKSLNEL